jgi:hypothetical protein
MWVAEMYIVAPETHGSRERGHRAVGGAGPSSGSNHSDHPGLQAP